MTDAEIYCKLKGGPFALRAVRECDRCLGTGQLYEGVVDTPCPDCDGHAVVFREWLVCQTCKGSRHGGITRTDEHCRSCNGAGRIPDEAGRAVIAEAVKIWIGEIEHWPKELEGVYRSQSPFPVWYSRRGKDWQSNLEAHVRNYHKPHPDLRANRGAVLKDLLVEAGYRIYLNIKPDRVEAQVVLYDGKRCVCPGPQKWADTEGDALIAATVSALGGR